MQQNVLLSNIYSGEGLRVKKIVNSVETSYVYLKRIELKTR